MNLKAILAMGSLVAVTLGSFATGAAINHVRKQARPPAAQVLPADSLPVPGTGGDGAASRPSGSEGSDPLGTDAGTRAEAGAAAGTPTPPAAGGDGVFLDLAPADQGTASSNGADPSLDPNGSGDGWTDGSGSADGWTGGAGAGAAGGEGWAAQGTTDWNGFGGEGWEREGHYRENGDWERGEHKKKDDEGWFGEGGRERERDD